MATFLFYRWIQFLTFKCKSSYRTVLEVTRIINMLEQNRLYNTCVYNSVSFTYTFTCINHYYCFTLCGILHTKESENVLQALHLIKKKVTWNISDKKMWFLNTGKCILNHWASIAGSNMLCFIPFQWPVQPPEDVACWRWPNLCETHRRRNGAEKIWWLICFLPPLPESPFGYFIIGFN